MRVIALLLLSILVSACSESQNQRSHIKPHPDAEFIALAASYEGQQGSMSLDSLTLDATLLEMRPEEFLHVYLWRVFRTLKSASQAELTDYLEPFHLVASNGPEVASYRSARLLRENISMARELRGHLYAILESDLSFHCILLQARIPNGLPLESLEPRTAGDVVDLGATELAATLAEKGSCEVDPILDSLEIRAGQFTRSWRESIRYFGFNLRLYGHCSSNRKVKVDALVGSRLGGIVPSHEFWWGNEFAPEVVPRVDRLFYIRGWEFYE